MFGWKKNICIPSVVCFLFFIAYVTLGLVKHGHYLSGYDLGIADQIVWKYSQFKAPITTVHSYAFTSLLSDHVEIIYILLAPFYWLYNNVVTLIVLQALFVTASGIPIYLLARLKKLPHILSLSLLFSYLSFYGVQNALWSDVHSLAFASSFLAWFIYFLYKEHKIGILVSLILVLLCKEDLGLLTFFISFVYFVATRNKIALLTMALSALYVGSIFFLYFPYLTHDGYRYAAKGGLFSNIQLSYLYDTPEKLQVYFYSFAWFGFIPLLVLLYVLPALVDISHYFLFGHEVVSSAQGLFLHYRITLAVLLVWPAIIAIGGMLASTYKKYIDIRLLALYIFICAIVFQYQMHEPLSYLTKQWFWEKPISVDNINSVIAYLPPDASVVSQNNITPHIAHRDIILTLWPDTKEFLKDSPCGRRECRWFHWVGNPTFMIVDTARSWDIRHFLANREDYVEGLANLEKTGVIKIYKKSGTTVLYEIQRRP